MSQNPLLMVVDMQNDFVLPTGSLSVSGAMNIIPIVNSIRDRFHRVIWTQDFHPADHISFFTNHPGKKAFEVIDTGKYTQVLFPAHCVQGTDGVEIHKDLIRKDEDLYVKKGIKNDVDSYSCFFDVVKSSQTNAAELIEQLGARVLYFLGVATDFCVKSSVLDAIELGYEVYVIEDGIAGCVPQDCESAIKLMKEKGAKFVKSTDLKL
ncbi:isochorismatase family protein [Tritrichomonas foetus]|uniref:nicotinamidase n=1 Tax=Tritrichomonas foetus TaxID=1144522 RepID=A0A1J4L6Q3_9EUKA|nr:isochorismatase family protein [Tritrichomonas foetus]|eukprot:OHT17684.1 isochorismatase family protein [Tritrichomonas foetus]